MNMQTAISIYQNVPNKVIKTPTNLQLKGRNVMGWVGEGSVIPKGMDICITSCFINVFM